MSNPHAIGEAFHITSDKSLSQNQIYNTIAQALGVKLHPYYVALEFLNSVEPDYDYEGSLIGNKVIDTLEIAKVEFKQIKVEGREQNQKAIGKCTLLEHVQMPMLYWHTLGV